VAFFQLEGSSNEEMEFECVKFSEKGSQCVGSQCVGSQCAGSQCAGSQCAGSQCAVHIAGELLSLA
jgi:hypothetical protein